jgi:hypothetical protein
MFDGLSPFNLLVLNVTKHQEVKSQKVSAIHQVVYPVGLSSPMAGTPAILAIEVCFANASNSTCHPELNVPSWHTNIDVEHPWFPTGWGPQDS